MPLTPGQSYTGVMILKEYFGLKDDQSLIQFAAEVKQGPHRYNSFFGCNCEDCQGGDYD